MLIPFRLIIKFPNMSRKEIIALVLKIIIAVCTIIGAALGVNVLSSCSASKSVDVQGKTTVVTVDTTTVVHCGNISIQYIKK